MDELAKAIENAAKLAGVKGLVRFTRFLDPAQLADCTVFAREYGAAFSSFGGYEGAERQIGCFFPKGEQVDIGDYPIVCLYSRYSSKFCSVSHRDILGSFMALGLTRACIGDIIIVDSDIYLFADENTADYIVASMTGAGRASLRFSRLAEIPPMPEPAGDSFSCVVSSLRLDAVLAGAYRLSRNEAQEMIRSGLVKVDHLVCMRVDVPVKENALLSLRGKGRIRLKSVDGTTRKQRIGITLFRYV